MDVTEKSKEQVLERRARLSPEKQALLETRLRGDAVKPRQLNTIPRRDQSKAIPLSFTQESLWLQFQLEPEGITYNLPAAIRLVGSLNIAALEYSINEIIKRHDVLRTNFAFVDSQVTQVIAPVLTLTLSMIELQDLENEEKQERVTQLIASEKAAHFNLVTDPLLRIKLIRLSTTEHIVLFTTHHIISDGWSRIIFIQELINFYNIFIHNKQNSVPELPIQYADFAVWQRQQLESGALESQLTFWKQQLAQAPFILNLPTDHPRTATRTFNGTRQLFNVPQQLTETLKSLSQQAGTTLFMTLLAAFQTLLYRYTGQEDFLIGSPIANRQRGELEGLIGFFANTIVLRAKLTGETRFSELLQQTKQTALSAYANQDVSFEKLVELIQPVRSSSYSPIFQVMFASQNQSIEEVKLTDSDLSLSLLTEDSDAAKFDLNLSIGEYQHGLAGKLEYNSDLFDAATIERMINHFQVLLDHIVRDPEQRISELPLLTAKEKLQLLEKWQPVTLEQPSTLCIHELFELQVNKSPDAEALIYDTHRLTYKQLNECANKLAHYLRSLGVRADVLVGIYIERSLEMVIGMLAILKAGGAYVPLDPSYPAQRLAYLIQDSGIQLVLSEVSLAKNIGLESITVVNIPDIIASANSSVQENLMHSSQITNLAYAIYTSGSTGKPKGVLVEHRNVTSFMAALDKALDTKSGVWLAQTSISFDISVLELLWTLTRGFKLVLSASHITARPQPQLAHANKTIDFSLFYFASGDDQSVDKYKLLLEGARFADSHGFTAVWTPERHFATFGGLYPNPAITSTAIAAITERVKIRAGSCVLPLHNPINIAEDWALVDNFSNGRIGVSFASGWQPNDFVLAPNNYDERNKIMIDGIRKVQALWRGESVLFTNGIGQDVEVRTLPRPIQTKLPMWLTASGNPETFRQAGVLGLNLLTHLLGQSIEELAEKIKLYQTAWQESGHGPEQGHVTLMLHTFIAENEEVVLNNVREPLKNYLRDSIGLVKPFADAMGYNMQNASEEDMDAILEYAFSRYYKTSGLFGTVQSSSLFVDQLKGIGVNEIACLIDFGIETTTVLNHLQHLQQLRLASQPTQTSVNSSNLIDTIPALIQHHEISHFQCTPALASVLMSHYEAAEALNKLHCFLVGGDSLPLQLAQNLSAKLSGKIFNMYGPTETTIWSTLQPITAGISRVLIGSPLDNNTIYILDNHYNPVPIGVPGEIYIGGSGVVRGYLNRQELTQERFITIEIGPGKKERVYRTGDRARYLVDGTIEHLGRVDTQVKIRGHRVELGEIQNVIMEYPGIREAVVLIQADDKEISQLIAYLVWDEHASQQLESLREFLKQQLPDYMIPAFFITRAALPLTPNGKIDRNALKPLELSSLAPQHSYVAPRTDLEIQIADIWARTMKREQVSIYDNFFELGGHSLIAAELAVNIQQALGKRLPLSKFFEHPTVAGIAEYLQGSLELLTDEVSLPMIKSDIEKRYQPFPLTDVQQAYLIGRSEAFELGNIATHGYIELDFAEFDHDRFTRAWNKLIQRHEMLRMIISEENNQRILAEVPHYDIPVYDVSDKADETIAEYLSACRNKMSHQVLPADQWPLFDICITKYASNSHRLHISIDTLIADGWSADILFAEFYMLYAQPEKDLPALSLSFRDYLIAERTIKETALYQRSREYWVNRIKDLPFGPKLPLAKEPSQIVQPKFNRRQYMIEKQRWQNLKLIAQKKGITPSVLLLTAYAEVLGYWSSEQNFCLNLTLFHRLPLHPQVNKIIGDFTSLTLLEVNQKPNTPFTDSALAIQKQLWNDLEHKYFSGIDVLREIARLYNSQQIAIMPVVFTSTLDTDTDSRQHESTNGLQQLGKEVYVITQTPQVWLDHQVAERDGHLYLTWDAVDELFPEALLDDMFNAYCELLKNLSEDNDCWTISSRTHIPRSQISQRQLLNHPQALPPQQLLHALFTEQVKIQEGNLAIISGQVRLTYGELNKLANVLGQRLRKLQCQPNSLVAVVMEKGWEQVAAVLGILMAGAAYLPIDASLPQERICQLLSQGEVNVVITQTKLFSQLRWPDAIDVLTMDLNLLNSNEIMQLEPLQKWEDLAYVVFTSGSTGVPKGVMIDHRGVVNTILDINQRFSITANDKILALSALSFDLSVYDIFGMLAAGGTIVIPEPELLKDPAHWLNLIVDEHITLWNSVPTFLQMLVDYLENKEDGIPESLRLALISGDAIPTNLPKRVKDLFPQLHMISLGGATEASIWSIFYPIEAIDNDWKSIPYGKPLLNQTMHVLKSNMLPSPVWVPGEIYIGGIGLAQGYWQEQEKTATSFIANPHSKERLYKTGDLGRYLPDGNIEFLGRNDYQVKIQGYRVELGEIESALLQHEAIEKAVVIAKSIDKHNTKRLIAYVVPNSKVMARYNEDSSKAQAVFKLSQQGIRKSDYAKKSIQLPPPRDKQRLTLNYFAHEDALYNGPEHISLQQFSEFINCISQTKIADMPLPKYYYPSAGNLYPVQAYLHIMPNKIAGIEGGFYYYNPAEHSLILLTRDSENTSKLQEAQQDIFHLFLIANLRAITPVYEKEATEFCLLEAGYMGQLLSANAAGNDMYFYPTTCTDTSQLNNLLQLETEHKFLHAFIGSRVLLGQEFTGPDVINEQAFAEQLITNTIKIPLQYLESAKITDCSYLERQSYRYFSKSQISFEQFSALLSCLRSLTLRGTLLIKGFQSIISKYDALKIYLHIKPNCVAGVEKGGVYYYDQISHQLIHNDTDEEINVNIHTINNQSIFSQAGFSMFFLVAKEALSQPDIYFMLTGAIGQLLMNIAPKNLIGICPIGSVDNNRLEHALQLKTPHVLLHSFVGGGIAEEQMLHLQQLQPQIHTISPENILQNFLMDKIPLYMIPTTFVMLDELPQSINGKINRIALSNMTVKEPVKNNFIAPESTAEKKIAAIWSELLELEKVSVLDNFFEQGGNSVLVLQVQRKLQAAFNVQIALVDLFKHTTIRSLANNLQGQPIIKNTVETSNIRAQMRRDVPLKRKKFNGD